jgi:multisubunit Na+/H+ antiporter MnhB subunit
MGTYQDCSTPIVQWVLLGLSCLVILILVIILLILINKLRRARKNTNPDQYQIARRPIIKIISFVIAGALLFFIIIGYSILYLISFYNICSQPFL